MAEHSFRFTNAIVREPSPSVQFGLRSKNFGDPDFELLLSHHQAYVDALVEAGLSVEILPALEKFPDSLFVEDAALCLPQGAVILSPGAASRREESKFIEPALAKFFSKVVVLQGPGNLDGGDVLVTESEIIVGLSERTNVQGVRSLSEAVEPWGYTVRQVSTPSGVLHLKSDCSLLDVDTILATRRLGSTGVFANYRLIEVPDDEELAANSIRVNDSVLVPAGFPQTVRLLEELGYRVSNIPNSECQKIDGGLSCLSLRFAVE